MFHKKVEDHFQKNDPLLHYIMKQVKTVIKIEPSTQDQYFPNLVREVVGQQLAGAAAEKIFGRLIKLFPKDKMTPKLVLDMPENKMRGVGLSRSKTQYIKNIASAVTKNKLRLHLIGSLTEEQIRTELTQIKGVGPWTADMFLIFTLAREDIFSYGDYGLKKAIMKLYKLRKEPSRERIDRLVKKWKPYRSYASLALWKSLEL